MKRLFVAALCASCLAMPTISDARTYVLPQVSEAPGTAAKRSADTHLVFTYTPSVLPDPTSTASVTIDFYLFAGDGASLATTKTGVAICGPCTRTLDASHRRVTIKLENEIEAKGGFGAGAVDGFGIIVVNGDDANVGLSLLAWGPTAGAAIPAYVVQPQPIAAPAP